mgnify:CR=1 FL=1
MPGFWPDGKSPLPDVLGGDSGKQRDVLWQYLEHSSLTILVSFGMLRTGLCGVVGLIGGLVFVLAS